MHGSNRAAGKEGEHFVTQNEEIRRYFFKLSNFFFVQKWGFWRIPPHLSQERLNAVQFLSRIFPTRRSIHTPSESVHKKRRDLFGLWGSSDLKKGTSARSIIQWRNSLPGFARFSLPSRMGLEEKKYILLPNGYDDPLGGKKLLSLSFSSSSLSANISESLSSVFLSFSRCHWTRRVGWVKRPEKVCR